MTPQESVKRWRAMLNQHGFHAALQQAAEGGDTLYRDHQLRILQAVENMVRQHTRDRERGRRHYQPSGFVANADTAQKALGRRLIDIGYKALASKLHPDKGGSPEGMSRLNTVRDQLRRVTG
jgi:hypothetical protein